MIFFFVCYLCVDSFQLKAENSQGGIKEAANEARKANDSSQEVQKNSQLVFDWYLRKLFSRRFLEKIKSIPSWMSMLLLLSLSTLEQNKTKKNW